MKITAGMVASELRKLADGLDKEPDAEIASQVHLFFHCSSKSEFLSVVRAMPRPLKKSIDDEGKSCAARNIEYDSPALWINTRAPLSLTCTLIQPARPAVYECQALLSADEEAQLEAANG